MAFHRCESAERYHKTDVAGQESPGSHFAGIVDIEDDPDAMLEVHFEPRNVDYQVVEVIDAQVVPSNYDVRTDHFVWRVSLGKEEHRELYALDLHVAALGGNAPVMPWFEYRKKYCKKVFEICPFGENSKLLMVEIASHMDDLPSPSNLDQGWVRVLAAAVMRDAPSK